MRAFNSWNRYTDILAYFGDEHTSRYCIKYDNPRRIPSNFWRGNRIYFVTVCMIDLYAERALVADIIVVLSPGIAERSDVSLVGIE